MPGGARDVVVIALVRDGTFYIDEFLAHYRALGTCHFLFCDNGSTDGTLERLARETDVTVISSDMAWHDVENTFREYAARRFCAGRWILYADMDEVFTFPGADRMTLTDLAARLDGLGATAMLAQMLEMVPPGPLQKWATRDYKACLDGFDRYDLSNITTIPYRDHHRLDFGGVLTENVELGPGLAFLWGGLRRRVFGENCCLTKHPLVFVGPGVRPGVHPHCAQGVRVAPVTGLIKHYKFAGNTVARDIDTLRRGVSDHGEDALRTRAFEADPDLTLAGPDVAQFDGIAPLIAAGFLLDWPEEAS